MSEPRSELRTPRDLFVYELGAVYDMEVKLVDALAEMSRTVTNENLSAGFAVHRTETETQVRRVEEAFEALGTDPVRRENPVVDGLLEDNARFDAVGSDDDVRNLRYLDAAVLTERIEITSYESLLRTATDAGLGEEVTAPLSATLEQEEKTLRKLRALSAESGLAAFWNELTGA